MSCDVLLLCDTFPEVLTPFQRLKYTIVKIKKRQSINCQRTPPTSFSPDDLWISRTFLLLKSNTSIIELAADMLKKKKISAATLL